MKTGRPKKAEIRLSERDRQVLEQMARSRTLPHGEVCRAQMILMSAKGDTNTVIANRFGVTLPTIAYWRKRYMQFGVEGLQDEPRSGRPRTYSDEQVAALINKVLQEAPEGGTHWSVRLAAKATGLSHATVHRYFRLFGLQPHRTKTFKLSNDKYFVEKVRDIAGLYLNPPDKALVLCVDEKSQIQALERTQPKLPMSLGHIETMTHDYIRHGTVTLFAALDIANGEVISQCKARHRHQEFLAFLRHIDANVPKQLEVHLIIDNYGTHKHAEVKAWLAARPRYHVHYTPTYSSWLNQVERWFTLISQRALQRDSSRTVQELVAKIERFVQQYNKDCRPFMWTATADSILEKIHRLCKTICETGH